MRPVNEIILHCTATPEGRPVTVAEIDSWHRARGWSGIGYHYVIHLDGRVEAGRPLEKIGAHVEDHNTGTIGVTYVGGVAANKITPKDTRTPEQKAALERLIRELDGRFNFKKLSGHYEYASKACPSFKVDDYRRLINGDPAFVAETDEFLVRGDTGPKVKAWRQRLADAGYEIPVTDEFDQFTEQVTRWFQAKRKIVIDGKVGAQTEEEMSRFLEGVPPFEALPATGGPADLFERKAPGIMVRLTADLSVSVEDAAAILGNIGHECAGFEHLAQINGSAYGWPQWDGDRRDAYFAWCKSKKVDRASDEANYGYLLVELKTAEKRALAALAGAESLDAKTIAFEKSYERAGVKHYASRQKYAERALAAFVAADGKVTDKIADKPEEAPSSGQIKSISQLQRALIFLGGKIDGEENRLGPRTRQAIERFERLTDLPVTGAASPVVMAAVQAVFRSLGGR